MQAILVHNSSAGSGRPSAERLLQLVAEAGLSPKYISTKDEGLPDLLSRTDGLVVAAGGDGTVARVATQLLDRQSRIVILPLGTANNTARAFGIAGTIEEIVAGLQDASERKLDIGVASGSFERRRFIESVGVGALADVTSRKNKVVGSIAARIERGRDTFRKCLRKAEPIRTTIRIDDKEIEEEMLLAEVMNIGFVGPGLRLAPQADAGDGLLDVVFLPADRREEMLDWLESPELDAPPVNAESGRSIAIGKNGAALRIGDARMSDVADGEIRIEIAHTPVTILVPPMRTVAAA